MATFLYRRPRTARGSGSKRAKVMAFGSLVLIGAYIAIFAIAPLLAVSGQTSAGAGDGPKNVWGYVYDQLGTPLDGITVTVTIKDPGSNPRATLTNISFAGGFYTVTFPESDWYVGDTIYVNATYGSEPATNSTSIGGPGNQRVDLWFGFTIPEFGAGMTALTAISVTIIVGGSIRRRKKKQIAGPEAP